MKLYQVNLSRTIEVIAEDEEHAKIYARYQTLVDEKDFEYSCLVEEDGVEKFDEKVLCRR